MGDKWGMGVAGLAVVAVGAFIAGQSNVLPEMLGTLLKWIAGLSGAGAALTGVAGLSMKAAK